MARVSVEKFRHGLDHVLDIAPRGQGMDSRAPRGMGDCRNPLSDGETLGAFNDWGQSHKPTGFHTECRGFSCFWMRCIE